MEVIYSKDGAIVRKSRNLRGLLTHATKVTVDSCVIAKIGDAGEYRVTFTNGDHCTGRFASFVIMQNWFEARRNFRHVPITQAKRV